MMKKYLFVILIAVMISAVYAEVSKINDRYLGHAKNSGCEMYEVEIDSCQYIVFGFQQSIALVHKGNCTNPIHRKNHD